MDNSMKKFTLSKNTFGQLCLETEAGQFHEQVLPVKAFPISLPGECIAIVDRDGHELVWLDDLNEVSADNQSIIKQELANREFMPVLTRISAVSYTHLTLPTNREV